MNRKIGSYILLALLVLSTIVVAVPLISTPVKAAGYSAWLKIVTTSWNGTTSSSLPGNFMPMFPDPDAIGFADRFNVTGQEAFVEVYSIKYDTLAVQYEGTFEPNATGFVKVSWDADPSEHAIMIVVKAKSYYGEKIGEEGELWSGIIMYALFLSPSNPDTNWKKFNEWFGISSICGENKPNANFSLSMTGELQNVTYADSSNGFNFTGPFDFMTINASAFAEVFGNETEDGLPVNAWVAQTAKIFKLFHVHSWYSVKDNLSFAQIKIYDLDHTGAASEESLIQAAVTGEDGNSRYTREVYPPEEALDDGKFENNPYVPIPLQIFNLNNKTVFHGGIAAGQEVGAPHLNATVRVWWETVIVNQTIYYGKTINGTLSYLDYTDDGLNLITPAFRGPLNVYHNASIVTVGGDEGREPAQVANFLNSTVFYAQFCTFDNDTAVQFPDYNPAEGRYREVYAKYASMDIDGDGDAEPVTGDQLIGALVAINLKTTNNESYYMTKNLLSTNETGCTDDPHKYRGGLDEYKWFARFPNATMWNINGTLYVDDDDNGIPDYFDKLGIGSFWTKFGDYVRLNVSLMYKPADADNKDDIPEGPNLEDVANPTRIGDEDVLESDYFNGNWSMLVADVSYANTLTLTDDEEYDGFDVLVSWKGGWQNIYPGNEELVGELHVKDPFAIAYNITNAWIEPHKFSEVVDWDAPIVVLDNVTVEGTRGRVNMTTYVYDIVFYVVDALGNPLPAAETEVDLRLPNGNFYAKTPSLDESVTTGVYWSYLHFGEGNVTFFQLPGNKGPYGVRVLYQGIEVYYNIDEIDVLTETTVVTVWTTVYKIKLVFYDCEGDVIPQLWVRYTMPDGRSDWRQTSEHGEIEFPFFATGPLTVSRVWWKGVEVPLMSAEEADGTDIPLTEDNELVLDVTEETDLPIKVYVPIKTLIFYTTDFQGEMKIPYLNITLTWIGTYKPWTDEEVYFLETLDPSIDDDDSAYNTSAIAHPLWFRYEAKAFFHKVAEDSPMDNLVEYEAKYVFYKMPPAIYNITVTTVTDSAYESVDGVYMMTPAYSKWPGRTDVEVPYEIKIDWEWAEDYEDSIPEIRTTPANEVNDRVVLRIFGSMDGVPVNTENFPEWLVDAWNPDDIGNRTALVCEEEITLRTWAHDFWKRVIDGDLRVGDAEFKIVNDNGRTMRYYNVEEEKWIGETYYSKWDRDIFDISALRKDSLPTSNIYWNGSYRLTSMHFETNKTYVYVDKKNESFTVDKFYNASAPNDVAEYLNFTLVGTENLWKTDRRFDDWVDRIDGNTWKDWFDAWFVVYELPSPDDEYVVEAGPNGKGVLPIPIPVAFIKLGAFGKDGEDNPLANALIELWIAHLDANASVKISEKDEGCKNITYYDAVGDSGVTGAKTIKVCWKWDTKLTESETPQVFEETRWDRVWLNFTYYDGEDGTPSFKEIYVQVPPAPAKLLLRNVLPLSRSETPKLDVAVSADYVYIMLETGETPNGLLAYGRWYTDEDGYVNSFKALGADDPRCGTVVLPISGWLNETFHDGTNKTEDEFHYQLNVVWKSAVVYSDNFLLDKSGYEIGPTEVYNPTFYMALCNSTDTVVKGLYVTIWYPNVTTWHEKNLWYTVPDKPEDLESTEDLPVYLSANELWSAGRKSFELMPGPRFMNTTWKYTFLANHSDIDWLDNLVATKLVLNNETFGDGALRMKSPTKDIDVPIMLAAAKSVLFEVLTWRDEAGIATAYPVPNYTVKYVIRNKDAGVVAAEGTLKTNAEGIAVDEEGKLPMSGTTVDKVFWVGMTIRFRVEPPEEFKDMTHAYYPDEEPSHWAVSTIDTWFTNVSEGLLCNGLCVLDGRSKPYLVEVDYTAVTIRVTDYNGRPVKGALVQLWDKASGKLAAWSETVDHTWTAKPVDMTEFWATHGFDPATGEIHVPFQDKAREFGGEGFTRLMNVSVGPVSFDANNDDDADDAGESIPYRGVPPGEAHGENPSYITYIVRTFWTPPGTVENGVLYPDTAHAGRQAKVYDSEEDEVTWKVLLPRHIAYWPEVQRSLRVYEIRTDEAPTGALVKEHRDVHAAIFDVKARFSYDGKPLGDFAKDLEVTFEGQGVSVTVSGKDEVTIPGLVRGTYAVTAKWKGVEVGRTPIDLSNVNVGTVTANVPLALTDVSFTVVDMNGRPLPDASVSLSPETYGTVSNVGGIITIKAIVTTESYELKASWTSPVYGTTAVASVVDTPEGFKAKRTVELPVGTVVVSVVDREGNPIAGAEVTFGKVTKKTDAMGKAYFEQVPLEGEAGGVSYDITVKREGAVVFSGSETVSKSKTTLTFIGELFTLKVRVVGAAKQPLPYAKVVVKRGGAEIGTFTADESGVVEVPNLPLSDYTVEVEWKDFTGSGTVSKDDLTKGRAVEIPLEPYIEIAGIPLTFGTFVALIIGIILLVIVVVIILSEYIRWRGRRLGIYPPAPPKK